MELGLIGRCWWSIIMTQGYSEIDLGESSLQATLRYHSGADGIYHWLDGTVEGGHLQVTVRSRD